ncbi:hypothetical protein [Nostoc sp.]|uniref:hypothetical protein n=1 Tax=Nostoc sp. TaxID=1180 RepID=UPI002FFBEBFF
MPLANPIVPTEIRNQAASGDYISMVDLNGIPYKISKADLLAGLSSSGNTSTNLAFASSGDANGICYWMGAKEGTWANPHTTGILQVSASSLQAGSLAQIVDRSAGIPMFTLNLASSWISVNFKSYKIKPSYYSIRHDNETGYYLRSWILQGSNDNGSTWVNLDVRTNDTTINSPDGWGSFPVLGANAFYRILRIISTGLDSSGSNYFCLGELEFYGEVAVL